MDLLGRHPINVAANAVVQPYVFVRVPVMQKYGGCEIALEVFLPPPVEEPRSLVSEFPVSRQSERYSRLQIDKLNRAVRQPGVFVSGRFVDFFWRSVPLCRNSRRFGCNAGEAIKDQICGPKMLAVH